MTREPFHVTPDPDFLYLAPSHKEAMAAIVYGVESRKGFIAVIGEVGSGKTTVVRASLRHIDREQFNIIQIFDPATGFEELIDTILQEMQLACDSQALRDKVRALHGALIEEFSQGRTVVLVVDEAQNMPVETLERLRMLSNLETERDKLIQIVLVGQPELEEKLRRHDMRQLLQRISLRVNLRALTPRESIAYVKHRLDVASAVGQVFTNPALRSLARRSGGNPRILSMLCNGALIAGFAHQRRPVTRSIVRSVASDYGGSEQRGFRLLRWASFWGLALALAAYLSASLY